MFCPAERWTKRADANGVLVVLVGDPHWGTQFHGIDRVRDVPTPQQQQPSRAWVGIERKRDVRKRKREIDLFQTGHEPRVLISGLDVHRTVEQAVDRIDSVARDVRQTGPTIDERDCLALFRPLDGRLEGITFFVDRHGVHRDRPTGTRRRRNGIHGRVRDIAEMGVVFTDGEKTACGFLAVVGPLERESDQVRCGGVLCEHVGHDGSG